MVLQIMKKKQSISETVFVGFLLIVLTEYSEGFNVDVLSRLVHQHSRETWFGYSVDIQRDNSGTMWLLAGAPKAQTAQPGVRNGGSVFRCSTTTTACQELSLDERGNNRALNGSASIEIDSKSNQLFGATVVASRTSDSILACAPSYTAYPTKGPRRLEPVGTCFLGRGDDLSDIKRFSPCNQDTEHWWGYHRTGYCQVGFSAAMSDDDDKLFMGAPGAWYWQGSLFVQDAEDESKHKKTTEGPQYYDDTYMGYAMSSGDLNGDGVTDVAIGVPKGNNLTGMVSLFEHNLDLITNLTGEQKGSYFGSAIAITDLDNDGYEDVIVGAPLYSDHKNEQGVIKSTYEVGKVYVFFQGRNSRYNEQAGIVGSTEWSRFGFSLAATGDLNGDGFNDFVVGAPYDGANRKGAIYVYHGMENGVKEKHSQVIFAETVDTGMTTFGFSLAGGRDIDRNTYPDLVVGAYQSSKMVMFKTRPVVSVTGQIKLDNPIIDLEKKMCPKPNSSPTVYLSCTSLELCLQYTGRGTPSEMDLNVIVSLDAEKAVSGRAYMLATGLPKIRYTAELRKEYDSCQIYEIYLLDTIRDKLNPIVIQANFSLGDDVKGAGGLRPVLDANVPDAIIGKLEIAKDCGRDNVCIPDLKVKSSVDQTKVILGADESFIVEVEVANDGEDAYEAQFYLTIPPGVDFLEYKKLSKLTATCSTPNDVGFRDRSLPTMVSCQIGNPLESNQDIKFQFELSAKNLVSASEAIVVEMNVNSTNEERESTLDNNVASVTVQAEVEANMVLTGVSKPEQVTYEAGDRKPKVSFRFDDDVGTFIYHLYEVRNRGPSPIKAATLNIYWPSFTQQGGHLLYLVGDPRTNSRATCKILQQENVNPDSLTLTGRPNITESTNLYAMTKKRLVRSPDPNPEDEVQESSFIGDTVDAAKSGFRKLIKKIKEYGSATSLYSGELKKINVDCTAMKCTHIRCDLMELKVGQAALVYVDSRLYVNTLIDEAFYDASISSVGIARVTELPFSKIDLDLPAKSQIVTTVVNPKDPTLVRRGVPWWVILVAILAGITFLILLIMLLWRIGFFKRTRPPKSQALLTKPPESEYYGYQGSGYAPPSMYSESQHGPRL